MSDARNDFTEGAIIDSWEYPEGTVDVTGHHWNPVSDPPGDYELFHIYLGPDLLEPEPWETRPTRADVEKMLKEIEA